MRRRRYVYKGGGFSTGVGVVFGCLFAVAALTIGIFALLSLVFTH